VEFVISIITPSYNQGEYLEATIQSVLQQDFPSFEYKVIDGESKDNSLQILKKYGSKLQWISEPDQGQADAINKGFRSSRGEVLGWLNADDLYCPGGFGEVARQFEQDSNLMMLYGDGYHVDAEGRLLAPYPSAEFRLESLAFGCFICQPACFFRRSLFEAAGCLDTSLHYALDLDLWIRFGLLQRQNPGWKFRYLPKLLALSRMHRDNKTLSRRGEAYQEIIQVVKKHFDFVPFNWVYGMEESSGGRFDGYFKRSPLDFSLCSKSALKWIWLNRDHPEYVFSFLADCLKSPRKSFTRLLQRTEAKQ